MLDRLTMLSTYLKTRHGLRFSSRKALEEHQQRMIARFMRGTLVRSPYYQRYLGQPLSAFPTMTKATMLDAFDTINTEGLQRDEAFGVAIKAEETRNFLPMLKGFSVGLSTGTSGMRGLFVTSDRERMRWAGIILARMLPGSLLDQHRIAFFLRANNNLYQSVSGRARIRFEYFDLMTPLADHAARLRLLKPTVLIAPAQVLRQLAKLERNAGASAATDRIQPLKIISVAEVLFDDDREEIEGVFGRKVDQIYQCTEGFLAYTCREGRLHLNETFLHIEPEWIDDRRTRFFPIVTDFSRETQPIVRYRLDDVLSIDEAPCTCGSPERVIARIEGRADDLLVMTCQRDRARQYLMPDFVVRALAGAGGGIEDFAVVQTALDRLSVKLRAPDPVMASVAAEQALISLLSRHGLSPVAMVFEPLGGDDVVVKRRRVRRDAGIVL